MKTRNSEKKTQFSETERHSQIQNRFRDLGSEYSFGFGKCRSAWENCVFVSEFCEISFQNSVWFRNFHVSLSERV